MFRFIVLCTLFGIHPVLARTAHAEVRTWDGRHNIDRIEVTVVYFVPADCVPLSDWRERVDYFCGRIEQFHQREYQGQSTLTTSALDEPFVSEQTTKQLRAGDGDFIFFRTLREVDNRLNFGADRDDAFPILLILSDVNWRPLDDFYRLKPGEDGRLVFEGNYSRSQHFPGAASGGARATYLADRGVGWGLVSADGWRVPYRGSDCVVYHEGVGHTVGLPHPQPGDGSVMSLGQYRGWISESWLDDAQKQRLGWQSGDAPVDRDNDLFSVFRALPDPEVPAPGEPVFLDCDWPRGTDVKSCRLRIQTDLRGPWLDVSQSLTDAAPARLSLGRFDRATPVSYRVDVTLADGQSAELWGYFQVRSDPDENPQPPLTAIESSNDLSSSRSEDVDREEIDLLHLINLDETPHTGEWDIRDGRLLAPRHAAARVEIPYEPPAEYRLTVIAEPLDAANGLILGQRSGDNRFVVLLNYANGEIPSSALENIDGRNVDTGPTTVRRRLFERGRPSQIICTVRTDSVTVAVDGRDVLHWQGDVSRLSLSDYWATPAENALFVGAFNCSYRFQRIGLTPISGEGRVLENGRDEEAGPDSGEGTKELEK